jgi:hypothetical protein
MEGGIVVLVGAVAFRTGPPADGPDAEPGVLAEAAAASDGEQSEAFERWRASLDPEATKGALILPLCSPSELADEIRAVLEGADAEDPALGEVIDFIETARGEAGGEEIVARLVAREDTLELTVLTRSGRELDRRVFDLGDGYLTADDIRRVVEGSVPVADGGA